MEKSDNTVEIGKPSDKEPYEKPSATRVGLEPEELLVVCSKREREQKCGGTASGSKSKRITVVAPKQS